MHRDSFSSTFSASLDNLSKLLTGLVLLINAVFVFKSLAHLFGILTLEPAEEIPIYLGSVMLTSVSIGAYLFGPKRYSLNNSELIIHRTVSDIIVPFSTIKTVRNVDNKDMPFGMRTFGVGGLFGYYGKFYNRKFGHMTYYVTQLKNYMVIKMKSGKTIVVSPDDTGLADILKSQLAADRSV